jgi:hypothetical protein
VSVNAKGVEKQRSRNHKQPDVCSDRRGVWWVGARLQRRRREARLSFGSAACTLLCSESSKRAFTVTDNFRHVSAQASLE